MTWLNPLALLGIVALGVPILIHLFGRRVARRLRFPSLRLLGLAMPTPATRTVPSDLLLLVVRCAIILAAVLALAQPLWRTEGRVRDAARPVRVVLVDTSASMHRLTSNGSAVDAARLSGRALLDSARTGILLETANPGASLAGAASWLARRGGLREVVVVSDFQVGAVEGSQVASLPSGIGVRLERVDVAVQAPSPVALEGLDSISADSSGTTARWASVRVDSLNWPAISGFGTDTAPAVTHARALRALTGRPLRPTDRVAVVLHGSAQWEELAAQATTLDSAWQGDLLVALRQNAVFAEFARTANIVAGCSPPGAPFATNASGANLASIARRGTSGASPLVVFGCFDPASVEATALLAAVATGLDRPLPVTELEPLVVPGEKLEQWRREALPSSPRGSDESSPHGRWLWLIALLLLGVEEWLRRKAPRRVVAIRESEVARARVA